MTRETALSTLGRVQSALNNRDYRAANDMLDQLTSDFLSDLAEKNLNEAVVVARLILRAQDFGPMR